MKKVTLKELSKMTKAQKLQYAQEVAKAEEFNNSSETVSEMLYDNELHNN